MNKNIVWGLVLIGIGAILFITTYGQGNRAFPAGIITAGFGVFRIIRGLTQGPSS
jgi:hypothetical protein